MVDVRCCVRGRKMHGGSKFEGARLLSSRLKGSIVQSEGDGSEVEGERVGLFFVYLRGEWRSYRLWEMNNLMSPLQSLLDDDKGAGRSIDLDQKPRYSSVLMRLSMGDDCSCAEVVATVTADPVARGRTAGNRYGSRSHKSPR